MLAGIGREAARFGAGLAGTVVFAAALAALAGPQSFPARLWSALTFDFGASTITGADSFSEIATPVAASAEILLPALALAFVVGVPLGLLLEERRAQMAVAPLMLIARAIPVFCGALLFAYVASRLFPGSEPGRGLSLRAAIATNDFGEIIAALAAAAPLVLPVALAGAGAVAAAVSGAVAEALREPYRDSLHRLGVGENEILRVYVARRALALSLTALGEVVLAAFAALAVVERLFDWPGAGAQFIQAAALQNWPVVAALVFVIAVARLTAELCGGLAAAALTGVRR